MTEAQVTELFQSLGFETTEYNISRYTEVRDFDFFATFENDKNGVYFVHRDGRVLVEIVKYDVSDWENYVTLDSDVYLAIAEVVKLIKEEYKGEIE
jgi:hypothetical protein